MAAGLIAERYQVGKKPQWSSVLSVIEAESYPLTSSIKKGAAPKGAIQNWQMKKYADPGHAGVRDLVDASTFNHNPRVDVQGVAQKVWYNVGSSDFAEETEIVGVGKGEFADQVYDGMVALKRIIEKRAGSAEDFSIDDGSSAAYETRGLFNWYDSTAQTATSYKVPDGWRTPTTQIFVGGALSALAEEGAGTTQATWSFMQMLRAAYDVRKGRVNLTGICGTQLKAAFAQWTRWAPAIGSNASSRKIELSQGDRAIVNIIDRLETDCGTVDLNISSYLYTNEDGTASAYTPKSGIFYPEDAVDMGYIRAPRVKNLEYQGGGYKAIIDAIFIVRAYNVMTGIVVKCNS